MNRPSSGAMGASCGRWRRCSRPPRRRRSTTSTAPPSRTTATERASPIPSASSRGSASIWLDIATGSWRSLRTPTARSSQRTQASASRARRCGCSRLRIPATAGTSSGLRTWGRCLPPVRRPRGPSGCTSTPAASCPTRRRTKGSASPCWGRSKSLPCGLSVHRLRRGGVLPQPSRHGTPSVATGGLADRAGREVRRWVLSGPWSLQLPEKGTLS
mmetsp:Transcript_19116/g.52531  ORF Transcript_19116/g.52531 Transcript_19116/m.52531 type:complete len:215 (-) Transcript_19116:91-735(-)